MSADNIYFFCKHLQDELYKSYHDNEWGKPIYDNNKTFEISSL